MKDEVKDLESKLCYKKKNLFAGYSDEEKKAVFDFAEGYKKFLDGGKTERECVEIAIAEAKKRGYKEYKFGDKLAVCGKYYFVNHLKSIAIFKIGKKNVEEAGVKLVVSHIDSPRLDIKQNPLYENGEMSLLKTHYYGGIKKYQWTAIPLALHGVVVLRDGTKKVIRIGENATDPVFYVTDLLPHLAREQMAKPATKIVEAENLNIVVGSTPYGGDDAKEAFKLATLKILNETYGMTEEDFLSAELTAVPAFPARDVGFDRALIGSYGHDDRVCAYPAMMAQFDAGDDETTVCWLVDKEEIGSEGNTGAQCAMIRDLIESIAASLGADPVSTRLASKCISSDVTSCYDPTYSSVFEKNNAALLSNGVAMNKFTGAGGKSGSNDASAEYVGEIRKLLSDAGVVWQSSELGRVDEGGGGTIAKYVAKLNIDTVDLGVPVLSMHAPYELISKADLYSAFLAFKAFLK